MKEKLLKLINAAIEETSMYESDYHYVNFKGIKEKKENLYPSNVCEITYKGKTIYDCYGRHDYCKLNTRELTDRVQGYTLIFGFTKEPEIIIKSIPSSSNTTSTVFKTYHKVEGTRKNFFGITRNVTFDVTVRHEPRNYEMKCGSFSYIIEDSVVEDFYNRIASKRAEYKRDKEVVEINRRLKEFRVKE